MASTPKLQSTIENAISRADSSYFFEDYSKQARAVIAALNAAGFVVLPKDFPESVWEQVAKEMRMGRLKPEEHVKDVYATLARVAVLK